MIGIGKFSDHTPRIRESTINTGGTTHIDLNDGQRERSDTVSFNTSIGDCHDTVKMYNRQSEIKTGGLRNETT